MADDGGVPTTVLTASISNVGNLSDPVDVIIEKLIRYVLGAPSYLPLIILRNNVFTLMQ